MSGAIFCTSQKSLDAQLSGDYFPESGSEAPFAQSDWVLSSIRTLDGWGKIKMVLIQDERPLSLAPLGKRPGFFSPYEQIGVADLGEPGELFYSPEHLRTLTNALAKERIPLSLGRVPAKSPLVDALRESYQKTAIVVVRPRVGCPYISFEVQNGDEEKYIPGSMMRDLRRARKRAEAIGPVSVEVYTPKSMEEFNPLWQRSLDIEASSWKGTSGTSLKTDNRLRQFYESYLSQICINGELKICFLYINSQPIAMQIAVEKSRRFWLLKIGYNQEYAKCSPGMLLMHETIMYAAKEKLKSYEFMGFADEWTRRWTQTERENVSISTYPYSFHGFAIFCIDMISGAICKLANIKGSM